MKISRRGSERRHGWYDIQIQSPEFSWDQSEKSVLIKKSRIKDFTGNASHDYKILVSLEEFARMLELIADKAVESDSDKETVSKALSSSIRSLVRLTNVSAK